MGRHNQLVVGSTHWLKEVASIGRLGLYSPKCLEGEFYKLHLHGILESSPKKFQRSLIGGCAVPPSPCKVSNETGYSAYYPPPSRSPVLFFHGNPRGKEQPRSNTYGCPSRRSASAGIGPGMLDPSALPCQHGRLVHHTR